MQFVYIGISIVLIFLNLQGRADEFVIPIEEIPKQIDPHLGNSFDLNKIAKQVFSSLIIFDKFNYPKANLVKYWKIDTTNKSIFFELKPGLYFHNNTLLTSQSVFDSMVRSKKMGSTFFKKILGNLECKSSSRCEGFQIVSEKSFRFFLKEDRYENFLRDLASMEGAIVLQSSGKLVGNGPYKISKLGSKSVELERVGATDGFMYLIFKEVKKDSGAIQFELGEVDYLNEMQYPFPKTKLRNAFLVKQEFIGTMYIAFNFNNANTPLVVRKKIKKCISQDEFVRETKFDLKPTKSLSFLPSFKGIDSKDELGPIFKIEKRTLEFYLFEKYRSEKKLIEYFDKVAACSGLKFNYVFNSFSSSLKEFRKGKGDLIYKGDGTQNYEPTSIYISFISGSNSNITNYSDKVLDRLVSSCEKVTISSLKADCLKEVEYQLSRGIPLVPLAHIGAREAFSSRKLNEIPVFSLGIKIWEFPFWDLKEKRRSK